jgi:hypothetical protein
MFEAYPGNPHALDYTTLETWLLAHKETLTSIKICYAHQQSSKAFFNASLFPKLQYLQLWRLPKHSRIQDNGPENENLLGPSLETFCWDYTTTYYNTDTWAGHTTWPPLAEREILWIRALAELASKRKAALKAIVIKYTLEDQFICEQLIQYPWELLKVVKDSISKLGIDLVYDEPQLSKDELLRYYATGKDYSGKLKRNLADPVHLVHSKPDKEEELRLEKYYDDLVERSRYHGEDIHKYLLD